MNKTEILEQIKTTKEQKAKAISEQHFEMASMLRDKEKMLGNKLDELERQERNTAGNISIAASGA